MSERPKRPNESEPAGQSLPIVLRCIDFRTGKPTRQWLSSQGIEDGSYFLYASAGASGNPDGFLKTIRSKPPPSIVVADHHDCGWYKNNGGDSPDNHHHNLKLLGEAIHDQNSKTDYQHHLLQISDGRFWCGAVAIILGEPQIVKAAREILARLGLADDHDEIARPYSLSIEDETLWEDLRFSRCFHQPKKIFLFEKDAANAALLVKKIGQLAPYVPIESIIPSPVA